MLVSWLSAARWRLFSTCLLWNHNRIVVISIPYKQYNHSKNNHGNRGSFPPHWCWRGVGGSRSGAWCHSWRVSIWTAFLTIFWRSTSYITLLCHELTYWCNALRRLLKRIVATWWMNVNVMWCTVTLTATTQGLLKRKKYQKSSYLHALTYTTQQEELK
jgi:hypothetical protein